MLTLGSAAQYAIMSGRDVNVNNNLEGNVNRLQIGYENELYISNRVQPNIRTTHMSKHSSGYLDIRNIIEDLEKLAPVKFNNISDIGRITESEHAINNTQYYDISGMTFNIPLKLTKYKQYVFYNSSGEIVINANIELDGSDASNILFISKNNIIINANFLYGNFISINGSILVNNELDLTGRLITLYSPITHNNVIIKKKCSIHLHDINGIANGTELLTSRGYVPVEQLQLTDLLISKGIIKSQFNITSAITYSKIVKINKYHIDCKLNNELAPVFISAGSLGNKLPTTNIRVSPNYGIMHYGYLSIASGLINNVSIKIEVGCEFVDYFSIETEDHILICANGAEVETLNCTYFFGKPND